MRILMLVFIVIVLSVYAPLVVHAPPSEFVTIKTETIQTPTVATMSSVATAPKKNTTPAPASKPTPKVGLPPSLSEAPLESEPPATSEMARVEAEVIRLTNLERSAQGLSPLSSNLQLRTIAWSHSADMVARNFFAHNNPDNCSSSCRADSAGYLWRMIGENIYMMSGFGLSPEKSAEMIVGGWMNSPGHRANILRSGYEETGIGAVVLDDTIYVTALYATPR